MQLFVIDGHDFTNHIKVPSYNVNMEEEYEEWKDGNYTKRREITRSKISGSFTMIFDDNDELDTFLDLVWTQKARSDGGAITATVYINNTHSVQEITAFIKFNLPNERPYFQREKLSGFSVTIEEQ